jgi:proton glutamate symport protein
VKSQSLQVLIALALGLAIGMAVAWSGGEVLATLVPAADVVGTLWINAIRMTVIPLVAALTITSVASAGGSAELRQAGLRAITVFVVLLVAGGLFALVVAQFSFAGFAMPADVAARVAASVGTTTGTPELPSLAQRLIDIIPANPIRAAADGALLPLVVFSLALGFALKQVPEARRAPVVEAAQGIADAMLVLVGWVVAVAPAGVFALALALGARLGASSVGALAHYIVTLSVVMLIFTALLYPVVVVLGRVPLRRFLSAAAPAQALAAGSRSSLSTLPLMISAARDRLELGSTATGFVLPLAVSIFRVNVPMAWVVGVVFLGKLYGIPVSEGALLMLIVTSTLLSFSVPGIPSGSLFLLAPVLVDIGLPAEGVGILIAVDVLPDMFKTLANVTAHLTAAALVSRPDAATPASA